MNARDALDIVQGYGHRADPLFNEAIAVLAAVLDERAELEALTYNVYAAIKRYQARDILKGGDPS